MPQSRTGTAYKEIVEKVDSSTAMTIRRIWKKWTIEAFQISRNFNSLQESKLLKDKYSLSLFSIHCVLPNTGGFLTSIKSFVIRRGSVPKGSEYTVGWASVWITATSLNWWAQADCLTLLCLSFVVHNKAQMVAPASYDDFKVNVPRTYNIFRTFQ